MKKKERNNKRKGIFWVVFITCLATALLFLCLGIQVHNFYSDYHNSLDSFCEHYNMTALPGHGGLMDYCSQWEVDSTSDKAQVHLKEVEYANGKYYWSGQ